QRTVASEGTGVTELVQAITKHQDYLIKTGDLARRERARLQNELELRIQETLVNRWRATMPNGQYDDALEKLVKREISPEEAALALVSNGDQS
ncbi:MAG TPA: hypothetical protein VI451_18785, partial [Anaerolineales bacterium]|nr:hypothetical protein [Anaerolineales bacterium]